ncbi:MAG: hypothetical protein ACOCUR_00670 [Nanoarchaeota archaeon]
MVKNTFFYFSTGIIGIVLIFLISGCTGVITAPEELYPETQEEFNAEATILSLEEKVLHDEAIVSLSKAYPGFAEEDDFGFFSPPARWIKFINCTSNGEREEFENSARTIVTYEYSGKTIRRTFKDRCKERIMTKHYCSGDRLGIIEHKCDSDCWMNEHCK